MNFFSFFLTNHNKQQTARKSFRYLFYKKIFELVLQGIAVSNVIYYNKMLMC